MIIFILYFTADLINDTLEFRYLHDYTGQAMLTNIDSYYLPGNREVYYISIIIWRGSFILFVRVKELLT